MNLRPYQWALTACFAAVLLWACDNRQGQEGMPVPAAPARKIDTQQLVLGERLYQANCASCHGVQAEGDPNWRQRDSSGHFPPPPLNGSGHAWHHSTEVLTEVITRGRPNGESNMPAWKGKLSEAEIAAIVAWFQSQWPQPVYDAWYEMQQRGR
jgi:mono/diheme cytochrome c family protein